MSYELENIKQLPDLNTVKRISQSLALLDAILMPEWEYRYFSFNAHWDKNEMMASMRNGEGDEYFILFGSDYAVGKVFAQSILLPEDNKKMLLDKIFMKFPKFSTEKAFDIQNISFAFWNTKETIWESHFITENLPYLKFLTNVPSFYQLWAENYYEKVIDIEAIINIFNHENISDKLLKKLNPDLSLHDIQSDLKEIGYI